LIHNFIISESSSSNIDLSFLEALAYSGTSKSYQNKLGQDAVKFVTEMESLTMEFTKIGITEGIDDMWDIPDTLNNAIKYFSFNVRRAGLSSDDLLVISSGTAILSSGYAYWAEKFNSPSNNWKTWWTSVGYDINVMRKKSATGEWLFQAASGGMSGVVAGKGFQLTGWGAVAASVFNVAIFAIYPEE